MTDTSTAATDHRHDKRLIVYAWLGLTAVTLLAWLLTPGHSEVSVRLDRGLVAGIVVIGAVKSRLIIRYFMEVRHAPRWLRISTDAWTAALWLSLFCLYLY
ncbi:cytochrome C oxidase subunit IV family protein [Nocardia barduliensis]|uniref:cytochrome C oxidase subunit IV family protein n=1 Tax=Nocardia barduliensis TaxID=2736643 RepID=UPI001574C207|nr:cytochrome C oxidase subunit IV family protein [Nocardia barduliensis]